MEKPQLTAEQRQEVEKQLELIRRGTVEVVPEEELEEKVIRSVVRGKPLRVKLGLDPTAPDIHIGHTVVLHKLRHFQQLGHEVDLIIGDFTGRIGDPTGKSETRKPLTEDEVKRNAETYQKQIFKILDPEKTTVHFNSAWLMPLRLPTWSNWRPKRPSRACWSGMTLNSAIAPAKRSVCTSFFTRSCKDTIPWRSKATSSWGGPIRNSTC